ncbi:Uncharacterised protein g2159 [Pycnogonum litorale]
MNGTSRHDEMPDIDVMDAVGKQIQLFLIVMYSLTAILSFVGNTTVIFVMLCGNKSARDFRLLLTNLAVSDITMAVFCIPFTYTQFITNRWVFVPTLCPVVQTVQLLSVTVSVYTLIAIGIDRYYAIVHPLSRAWTRSHGAVVIAMIWIFSVLASVYQFLNSNAEQFEWDGQLYYTCEEGSGGQISTIFVFCNTFVLPLLILTYCYAVICRELKIQESPGESASLRYQEHHQNKLKAIKMLTVVVVLFALCWLPLHLFMLCVYFHKGFAVMGSENHKNVYVGVFLTCHWLAMANSFVNPIIYNFMCENFRTDAKNLFLGVCKRGSLDSYSNNGMYRLKQFTSKTLTTPGTSLRLKNTNNIKITAGQSCIANNMDASDAV